MESGIHSLGGNPIFYSIADSPLGKMKENISDTAKTSSRYVSLIAARVHKREDLHQLALHATVPVINLLDDLGHPCQILADLMTITEKKGATLSFSGHPSPLHLVYFGDAKNNVTYDLMRIAAILGWKMDICCPHDPTFSPEEGVLNEVQDLSLRYGGKAKIKVIHDAENVSLNADIIYTDTWMSYSIKPGPGVEEERKKVLAPYVVDSTKMSLAKPDALFMHCLPATRGNEVTGEVIDGPHSIVFDQAENRLHIQKAIMLFLLGVL